MKTVPAIIISEDQKTMSRLAAKLFLEAAQDAISKRGKFTVALSGGSTPTEFFQQVSSPAISKKINWKKIYFFWSDERFLSHLSPDSNYHVAKNYLLKKIPTPVSNIFPVPVKGLPGSAATRYEKTIKKILGAKTCFDWVMLGAGKDGHTASLFPGSKGLLEKKKLVIAVWSDTDKRWRISFSFALINKAREIIVLVSGKEKAAIVKAALSGKKAKKYPVQYIDPARSLWLLDQEAADLI